MNETAVDRLPVVYQQSTHSKLQKIYVTMPSPADRILCHLVIAASLQTFEKTK
jgi:hypothetical protein